MDNAHSLSGTSCRQLCYAVNQYVDYTALTIMMKAIDEIGWTPYHLKLFFLNGFG